jgi:sialidase-1
MAQCAEVLWSRVICKEQGRYIGWPTIVQTKSGQLLVVFSGDRDDHFCPWGKTELVRSGDEGETWTGPEVIRDTPLDDRDAGIIQTARGTLVVSWFTSMGFERDERWRQHAASLPPQKRERWLGRWIQRSEDEGVTWEQPIPTVASAPHGPIQLRDGRLLYLGIGMVRGERTVVAEESADDGRSWQVIGTVSMADENSPVGLGEPHLVETRSGKLVGMFRTGPGDIQDRYLYQSESEDGGITWTPAYRTTILGFPPHLIRLADDHLLVVFGRRFPPYGQWACSSRDEGASWDTEGELFLSEAANDDLGYPASVQLADGSILTIYYQIDQPGETTCLMGTRWRL